MSNVLSKLRQAYSYLVDASHHYDNARYVMAEATRDMAKNLLAEAIYAVSQSAPVVPPTAKPEPTLPTNVATQVRNGHIVAVWEVLPHEVPDNYPKQFGDVSAPGWYWHVIGRAGVESSPIGPYDSERAAINASLGLNPTVH